MSISGIEHVLMRIKVFKGFRITAVCRWRRFALADEGMVWFVVNQKRLEVLWNTIKFWSLQDRRRERADENMSRQASKQMFS